MKKTMIIVAALVAVSFASCKKNRTCTCTSTSTDVGTNYSVDYSTFPPTQTTTPINTSSSGSTQEIKYNKISKKYGNENCAASVIYTDVYDQTNVNAGFTTGSKGTRTYTTTCTLK